MYTNDGSINHEQHDEFDFVIRKRYLSGHSLLGLWALIGSILCLLPLFSMWIFYDESDGQRTAPIYSSMTSPEFTHTVVACTAISVPMIMDFILNTMSLSDNTLFTRGSTVRAVLLLALFIPNMCIMFSAIRLRSPLILVCMFGVRGIVLIYAIGGHLWEFGAPIFQCNLFLFTLFIHMVSYIIRCYSVFSEDLGEILFYSYIGLSCLGLVMFLSLGYKWLKLLFSQPITELTVSQYSCNVVLISASIPLCMFILMSIITGGTIDRNTSVAYLTIYTYIETAFVVSIALLQSRLVTQEILKAEKNLLEMKRTFVRHVSHEIRTPLNIVVCGIDLIESELLRLNASAETLDTLTDLQSSVDIAVNTLNELLDYEKLDAGLMRIEPEIIEVIPLLINSMRPFNLQADDLGVNFTSDVGLDDMLVELQDVRINADRIKFSQVIRNLVSNSLKFTPRGGRVTIKCHIVQSGERQRRSSFDWSPGQRMLQIEVVDTGAGISVENLPKLFNEIVQFNPGKLQQGGGSGIGLWISQRIMKLHNGNIFVSSEGEGQGSTFIIQIPIIMESDPSLNNFTEERKTAVRNSIISAIRKSKSRSRLSSIYPSFDEESPSMHIEEQSSFAISTINEQYISGSGNVVDVGGCGGDELPEIFIDQSRPVSPKRTTSKKEIFHQEIGVVRIRILLVDDTPMNRKMMVRGLNARGYRDVVEAVDGVDGLRRFGEAQDDGDPFDVVLLDYQMPNMDGPTAAGKIRGMGFTGLIFGVTGNGLPEDVSHFISKGATKVFLKPVNMDELHANIKGDKNKNPNIFYP